MVVQSFTWFVDLSTSADTVQVISITAGGNPVKNRLMPFFTAYKYFKLGGVSVKFCPASTLPVDPTGLSYEVGENTVDPRDQFNPGLIRITNGEDFYLDATALSSANADAVYYNMMLDKRWFKFQLQAGTKRYAKPLFWSIAQAHQDNYPGITVNYPKFNDALKLAKSLAKSIPEIKQVEWKMIITKNGPVVIEGGEWNDYYFAQIPENNKSRIGLIPYYLKKLK